MSKEKSIVVGCDCTTDLSVILDSLRDSGSFSHHIISATRASDLVNIAKTLDIDLVILCFSNNQQVLTDFDSSVKKTQVPILCLSKSPEKEPLYWSHDTIVFTCPMQHINNSGYLISRINSIFLLNQEPQAKKETAHYPVTTYPQRSSGYQNDLSRYVMELDQKTNVLSKVTKRIADLYPDVDDKTRTALNSIVNGIRMSANDTKLWEDFKLYFEMTNPDFLLFLAQKHPGLTTIDLKYCCYLKMSMSNDDIRSLLGINQESVRTHKYRLKKKLDLPGDMDLGVYLKSVS
jgi:DNA-binding CsgD family transcriptional regulator